MAAAEFLSTEELAKKKGFSATFIKKAARELGLPHYRFGKLLKFKESDFDKWAEQRMQQVG